VAGLHPVAEVVPGGYAAVDDVHGMAGAIALQEARRHPRALARTADGGHRPLRVQPLRDVADVVVGDMVAAGDVAGVPLGPLAHVDDLPAGVVLGARVAIGGGEAADGFDTTPPE